MVGPIILSVEFVEKNTLCEFIEMLDSMVRKSQTYNHRLDGAKTLFFSGISTTFPSTA